MSLPFLLPSMDGFVDVCCLCSAMIAIDGNKRPAIGIQ